MEFGNRNIYKTAGRNLRLDFIKGVACFLIVFLHNSCFTYGTEIHNTYDLLIIMGRVFVAVGVPAFMGISGYFMFFYKEREFSYGFKALPRYLIMLILWAAVYFVVGYMIHGGDFTLAGIMDGIWGIDKTFGHLWYIKLYVVILATFPLVGLLTQNMRVLKFYIGMWLSFFSLRFTLGIAVGIFPNIMPMLQLFQLPFFEYKGYVGGSLNSEFPMAYVGPFILLCWKRAV